MPFGKDDSLWHPWLNLKVGAEYMFYTDYNGANTNYDGYGRNASSNNAFLLFAWTIF